jgi:hypothetical protein
MKKYLSFLILFALAGSLGSCSNKYELKLQRIQENPFEKGTFLINTIIGNETFDDLLCKYQLCRLDDKSYQPVPSDFYDRLRLDVENYDSLDFNDLIAVYRPNGKSYFEIGRFDTKKNHYKTLFTDPKDDVTLIFDSKKHNLVFYCYGNVPYSDIWIMDREGNHKKILPMVLGYKFLNADHWMIQNI